MSVCKTCVYWDKEYEECIHPSFPDTDEPETCLYRWDEEWEYGKEDE